MTYAGDRLRAAIEAVVQAMMPSPVYSGAWPGVVVMWDETRQRAEIATDSGSPLPRALRGVPALVDPPGTKVSIPAGTPVLVSFRGSNPAAPYFRPAAAWGDSSVPLPSVGLAGGGAAVARVGDAVSGGELAWFASPPGFPIPVWLYARSGTAWIPLPVYPTPAPVPYSPAQPGVTLGGQVSEGSSRVTCG